MMASADSVAVYIGVAMVTQCPIIPGHSFLYDFRVADQAGTFWYDKSFGFGASY